MTGLTTSRFLKKKTLALTVLSLMFEYTGDSSSVHVCMYVAFA